MNFVALAADYDGTLAEDGRVSEATVEALRNLKAAGRKLLMVTGRELPSLEATFSEIALFDLLVLENGAVLYDPATRQEELISAPPPEDLVARLRALDVSPLSVGRSVIATWEPNEGIVLQAIKDLGHELHIIFNKGAVMVLPANVNKATGLAAALKRMKLSSYNVVGIGDAENDQAFLQSCGCAVAVENALQPVKDNAHLVVAARGAGVQEIAKRIIETDLFDVHSARRARPSVGTMAEEASVFLDPLQTTLLAGTSGAGKSTTIHAVVEQMLAQGLQFCIVDPEGDYSGLENIISEGTAKQPPDLPTAVNLLEDPQNCLVINLLAVDVADRPAAFRKIHAEITKLRTISGRPHWLIVDEAHHFLPRAKDEEAVPLPDVEGTIFVTVHPEAVSTGLLAQISTFVGIGPGSQALLATFAELANWPAIEMAGTIENGQGVYATADGSHTLFQVAYPAGDRQRHARKYAEGELGEDKSFYFKGPDNKLNLRAHNLATFLQLAKGVDDDTWMHHLREGAYSAWMQSAIKDEELAQEVRGIETDAAVSSADSRTRIASYISRRYTASSKPEA